MARGIIKLADQAYVEWSTVVDAPTTYVLTRDEMLTHLNQNTFPMGKRTFQENEKRLQRADQTGTSFLDSTTRDQLLAGNRAGPKESTLTLEEILRDYNPKAPAKYTQPA